MNEGKKRHGFLTAWLVLIIIGNAITVVMYLFGSAAIKQNLPSIPGWTLPVLAMLGVVNIVCSIALFQWKKWGFYGFTTSAAVAFLINLMIGLSIIAAILGLVGVAIFYGALQIGKENKGWTQLE